MHFKSLPHDITAESGVICTIIQNPEYILHSEYLKPNYFYKKENGAIYWAINELYKKGINNIDAFNIITQINNDAAVKKLMSEFDIESIKELVDISETLARNTINEYKQVANIVTSLSFKRDLYNKLKNFESMCLDENNNDLNSLNVYIYEELGKLAEQYITNEEICLFDEVVDDLWREICDRRNNDGLYGIPSKFPLLNNYFIYEKSEMVLLSARMKRGKSAFFMNEIIHKLKNNVSCIYLDTEMQSRLFFERMLSSLTQIPIKKIKNGSYSLSEEQIIKDTIKWIKTRKFAHIYDPEWTKDKIYTICKILKYKINYEFMVYDYIKVTNKSILSSSEQYNELGAMCDFLKNNIAGGLDVAVLAGAQLNRKDEVADSDKIERYVSTSITWREKTNEEIINDGELCGNYALNIKLNRLGEQMEQDDYIDFIFKGNIMTIEQAIKQHNNKQPDFIT